MDNNLGNIIKNASARAWIYGTYVVLGLVIGALQAWYDVDPEWLLRAFGVWAYLGLPVASLAGANSNIIPTRTVIAENVENISSDSVNVEASAAEATPGPLPKDTILEK